MARVEEGVYPSVEPSGGVSSLITSRAGSVLA
jgi:hypothetical protein